LIVARIGFPMEWRQRIAVRSMADSLVSG
jgi:hypothetical protein